MIVRSQTFSPGERSQYICRVRDSAADETPTMVASSPSANERPTDSQRLCTGTTDLPADTNGYRHYRAGVEYHTPGVLFTGFAFPNTQCLAGSNVISLAKE